MQRVYGDGCCLFRCLSYQLFGSEDHHLSVRFLLQRFENLNKSLFDKYLTSVNKPTIDAHVHHIGQLATWGTHIELMAAATYFQPSVYYSSRNEDTNEFRWRCIKPLKALSNVRLPLIVDDPLADITVPHHFELVYTTGLHYDCAVLESTNTISEEPPPVNVDQTSSYTVL